MKPANFPKFKRLNFKNATFAHTETINTSRSELSKTSRITKENIFTQSHLCKSCENLQEAMNSLKKMHEKEIKHLTFLLGYKDLALKKRENMLYEYNKENLELRAKVKNLSTIIEKNKLKDNKMQDLNLNNDEEQYSLTKPSKRLSLVKTMSQQSFSHINLTS